MDENLGKAPLPPPIVFFTNIENAVPSKKEGSDANTSDRKRRYIFVVVSFLLVACLIAALVTAAILAFEVNRRIWTNNEAGTSPSPVDPSQPTIIRPTVDPGYTSDPHWTSTYSPKPTNEASCSTAYLPAYTCSFGSCSNVTTPSSCCSFPMTLNENLLYGCTKASKSCIMSSSQDQTTYRNCVASSMNGSWMGCFVTPRTWSACQDTGFVAKNETVSLTIPSLDVPIQVRTVNNWIMFQQRINSSLDFNRSWSEYKSGFGIYNGNFWMGLEKIYQLTSSGQYRLRLELLTIDGRWISSEYETFKLANEQGNYTIHVSGYSGDGGDFMADHNGKPFSTYDRNNAFRSPDSFPQNCAAFQGGGWWFYDCSSINANGIYNRSFEGCFLFEGRGCVANYISVSRLMMKKL